MSQDSNGSGPTQKQSIENHEVELRRLRRLIAEAQARGEDPRALVKRAVLSTIDALRTRRLPTPKDDP